MRNFKFKQKSKIKLSPIQIGFIASFLLHSTLFATLFVSTTNKNTPNSSQSKSISIGLHNIQGNVAQSTPISMATTSSKEQIKNLQEQKAIKQKPKKEIKEQIKQKILQENAQKAESKEIESSNTTLENTQNINEDSTDLAQNAESSDMETNAESLAQSANQSENIEILGNDNALYQTILDIIGKYQVMPKMALKRGLFGDVMVEFVFKKDGSIENVRVIKDSHKILNKDAINTIYKSYKDYPKPNKNVLIKVNIKYNLLR
ncbi:MAG: TonB family protein [Helicobacteraceae bacterium]|nr:TonB family protein [Helicobacteraceae bacterium]